MVLLVNVPIKHGHILVRHQRINHCGAIFGGPVPIGIKVEQRPVCQHNDARISFLLLQVGFEPVEL